MSLIVVGRSALAERVRATGAELDAVVAIETSPQTLQFALEREIPYVDASTDAAWVAHVLTTYRDAPSPVLPACGFDGLVGDLAAAVAAQHFGGPVDDVAIHHDRDVALAGTPGKPRRVAFPNGTHLVVDTQFIERVLVPRHVPGARVATTRRVRRRRLGSAFQIVAEASGFGPPSYVVCTGVQSEDLTARLLVAAARATTIPGAMAPAEAFDAEDFLDSVAAGDLDWSFDFPETPF